MNFESDAKEYLKKFRNHRYWSRIWTIFSYLTGSLHEFPFPSFIFFTACLTILTCMSSEHWAHIRIHDTFRRMNSSKYWIKILNIWTLNIENVKNMYARLFNNRELGYHTDYLHRPFDVLFPQKLNLWTWFLVYKTRSHVKNEHSWDYHGPNEFKSLVRSNFTEIGMLGQIIT